MRLEHRRHVGQHQRHGVVGADAAALQRGSKLAAAAIGVGPGAFGCHGKSPHALGVTAAARSRKVSGDSGEKLAAFLSRSVEYCDLAMLRDYLSSRSACVFR